jgi:hypothetical protein
MKAGIRSARNPDPEGRPIKSANRTNGCGYSLLGFRNDTSQRPRARKNKPQYKENREDRHCQQRGKDIVNDYFCDQV